MTKMLLAALTLSFAFSANAQTFNCATADYSTESNPTESSYLVQVDLPNKTLTLTNLIGKTEFTISETFPITNVSGSGKDVDVESLKDKRGVALSIRSGELNSTLFIAVSGGNYGLSAPLTCK